MIHKSEKCHSTIRDTSLHLPIEYIPLKSQITLTILISIDLILPMDRLDHFHSCSVEVDHLVSVESLHSRLDHLPIDLSSVDIEYLNHHPEDQEVVAEVHSFAARHSLAIAVEIVMVVVGMIDSSRLEGIDVEVTGPPGMQSLDIVVSER